MAVLIGSYLYVILRDGATRQLKAGYLMRPTAPPEGKDVKVLQGQTLQPPFYEGMQSMHEPVHFVDAAAREYA